MDSYTFGSDEFMAAILEKRAKSIFGNYEIGLNAKDFQVFITILQGIALYGEIDRHKLNDLIGWTTDDPDPDETEPVEDWAWQFLSNIGETLGIESI